MNKVDRKIQQVAEMLLLRDLIEKYPTGILSIVSDTFNLWDVCTEYLPRLKEEILARDGKLVIRPDSGDPVDIICGLNIVTKIEDLHYLYNKPNIGIPQYYIEKDNIYYEIEIINDYSNDISEIRCDYEKEYSKSKNEAKGVIELLWDIFGGTVNEQGYKVLDSHIGAIYGDSITTDRANEICKRLEDKGFASTNVVLGIGSFTYQYNTRDTFGFAMKATYVERKVIDNDYVESTKGYEIFKDPITDSGMKKSAKGLLKVVNENNELKLVDQITWEEFNENDNQLRLVYRNGNFSNTTTLENVRNNLKKWIELTGQ